jgi:putative transposase
MARTARVDIGDIPYHILNRAVGKMRIFNTQNDYQTFLQILADTKEETGMRILAFDIMPNHWHLSLYPREDGDLGVFMHRLTNAHTRRVHAETGTTGTGPLYQGRYKSFMIEDDTHLFTVIKYIERNPVRAGLVRKCEDWQWGSAWLRAHGNATQIARLIDDPPIDLPKDYLRWINTHDREDDLEQLRISVRRGAPFGGDTWMENMIQEHDLLSTVRREGRPSKSS